MWNNLVFICTPAQEPLSARIAGKSRKYRTHHGLHLHASWKCISRPEGLFFYHKSILVWAFFQIEMLFSDKNNPWLKILPNKDAFHHHKIIPVRIFFRIRITPSLKSNLWQHVLPNKDESYRNKAIDASRPIGSRFSTTSIRSKFPIYIHSGEPQRFHAPILLSTTKCSWP